MFPLREILLAEAAHEDVMYFATPQPDVSSTEYKYRGPRLEGGDALVYGKEIFVGTSGNGSDEGGWRWRHNTVKPLGFNVHLMRLASDMLHLDCVISLVSLVREGLMLVCEEALIDGIPEEFKDWEKTRFLHAMRLFGGQRLADQ